MLSVNVQLLRRILKMLKIQGRTFGIITKLMALSANGKAQKHKMHLL